MRHFLNLILLLTALCWVVQPAPARAQSADLPLDPPGDYWTRWTSLSGQGLDSGGVVVHLTCAGVTDSARLPPWTQVGSLARSGGFSTVVGICIRVENKTNMRQNPAADVTLVQPDGVNGFAASYTSLVTNLGPIAVRDFSNSQGRESIPRGAYRTYDLIFLSNDPVEDLQEFVLTVPRFRGYRWTPVGEADYLMNFWVPGL